MQAAVIITLNSLRVCVTFNFILCIVRTLPRVRSYQRECDEPLPNFESKLVRARAVLTYGSGREGRVSHAISFCVFYCDGSTAGNYYFNVATPVRFAVTPAQPHALFSPSDSNASTEGNCPDSAVQCTAVPVQYCKITIYLKQGI